jgi:hypothetical protein
VTGSDAAILAIIMLAFIGVWLYLLSLVTFS